MKKLIITIMCVMLASLSLFFISCGEKHELVKVNKVDATCETDGNIEYYKCNHCDKWFTDETAEKEITDKSSVVIAKLGHDYDIKNAQWTWVDYESATVKLVCKNNAEHTETLTATITDEITTEPTCTEKGVKTYTATATFNNKTLSDTKTEEIDIIPHTLTSHEAVESTCSSNGNIAYWTCDECGKYFADADGKTEITKNDTILDIKPHEFVDGKCKYCDKTVFELPLVSSNEKITGEYIANENADKTFRFTYFDGVMNNIEPYNLTIPVEIVNEIIKQGYDSFMIYFSRDGKKATSFDINGIGDNAGAKLQLTLTKDMPLVIENVKVLNICDEVWSADGYTEADSYIVRIVYNKVFDRADPMTYMHFTHDTTYSEGKYNLTMSDGHADLTIRKEYIEMLKETNDRFVVRVDGSGALTIAHDDNSYVQPAYVTMMFNPEDITDDLKLAIDGSDVDITVEIICSKKFDPLHMSTYFCYDVDFYTKEEYGEDYLYFDYKGWHSSDNPANRVDNKAYLKKEYIAYLKDNFKDKLEFTYGGGFYQYIIYNDEQTSAANGNKLLIDVMNLPDNQDILIVTGSSHGGEKYVHLSALTTKYFPEKPETKLFMDLPSTYNADGSYSYVVNAWDQHQITVTAGYIKELKDAGKTKLTLQATGGGTIYFYPVGGEETTAGWRHSVFMNLTDYDGVKDVPLFFMCNFNQDFVLELIVE